MAPGKERFVSLAKFAVAVDARASEMRAVISASHADEFRARRLPAQIVILPCKLQPGFDAVRAARREEYSGHSFLREEFQEFVRKLYDLVVRASPERGIIRQVFQLLRDRFLDGAARVAKIDVPKTADRINEFPALQVSNLHTLAADDYRRRVSGDFGRIGHRLPKLLAIVMSKEIGVFHCCLPPMPEFIENAHSFTDFRLASKC